MSVVSPKEKLPDEEAQVDAGELSVTDAEGDSTLDPRQTPKDEATLRQPEFQVGWDGPDDPENPMTWGVGIRWFYTMLAGVLILNATFASSAPSGIVPNLMKVFTFSEEVGTLMISLFVAGYCVGPILWGPLSEYIGRRPVFIISFVFYVGFQVGCALSKNTASILIFRFLGGCAAASPLANSGALIADIWDAKTRGRALGIFTLAPFAGPALGPIVGGFIGISNASWRWLFWVLTLFAGFCLALIVFTLPETYAPLILKRKAQRKRDETGDDRYFAPIEARKRTMVQLTESILARPFKMLFYEPMLSAITLYMSFVYGCVYLLFESYPIVFGPQGHGFNAGVEGLMFLPVLFGGVAGAILSSFYFNVEYIKLFEKTAPRRPPPEVRLQMCAIGGPIFAIGFFWMGWTSYKSVNYWAPMLSGFPVGLGLILIFQGLFNFVIDTYLAEAATALSAVTVVRSMFGAGFPLFATQMYNKLNPRWASTLIGCITLLLVPIPIIFMRWGPTLRARSRFTPDMN